MTEVIDGDKLQPGPDVVYLLEVDLPGGESGRAIGRTQEEATGAMLELLGDLERRFGSIGSQDYASLADYVAENGSFTTFLIGSANNYGRNNLYLAPGDLKNRLTRV